MHNTIKTIILSSLGGGGHERLAKVYRRNHNTENITSLSLQYLERSTICIEKDSNCVKSETGNYATYFFNYLQKIGFYQLINIIAFLTPLFEFLSRHRVATNLRQVLYACNPDKIVITQPIHLPTIIQTIDKYQKSKTTKSKKKIKVSIESLDFFSRSMPYWHGVTNLPLQEPDHTSVAVIGPESKSAQELKKNSHSWLKFYTHKLDQLPLRLKPQPTPSDPKSSRMPKLSLRLWANQGVKWEIENAECVCQAGLGKVFNSKTDNIKTNDHIVVTTGSQGSVPMTKEVISWYELLSSKTASMVIFAGKSYEQCKNICNQNGYTPLARNNHHSAFSPKLPSSCLHTSYQLNGRSLTLVSTCDINIIQQQKNHANILITKPGGASIQEAIADVNARLKMG